MIDRPWAGGAGRGAQPAPMRTDRLLLRLPEDADLDVVVEIYADPRTSALSPLRPLEDEDEARELLSGWRRHWRRFNHGAWAIETLAAPGRVVGFGGVTRRDFEGDELPNLWYRLAPGAWGRGYATELARAALADARGRVGLGDIHAIALPENHASIHVLEKLGMRRNGVLPGEHGTCTRFLLAAAARDPA
ncbi:MAG TPA: GNAT family N-acetyltransferase [Burkholderiaceae bacterium]